MCRKYWKKWILHQNEYFKEVVEHPCPGQNHLPHIRRWLHGRIKGAVKIASRFLQLFRSFRQKVPEILALGFSTFREFCCFRVHPSTPLHFSRQPRVPLFSTHVFGRASTSTLFVCTVTIRDLESESARLSRERERDFLRLNEDLITTKEKK